jgi:hypothetical protein
VTSAIVASTITTLVIFLPLVFMRGVSGILFNDLAVVIVFSLVCSLLVALTLVPMLASRLLRPNAAGPASSSETVERAQRGSNGLYVRALRWSLAHRALTVATALALLGGSLALLPLIGTELIPPSDEGEVRVTGEMDVGTRLDLVDQQTQRMEAIVEAAVPETVASEVSVQNGSGEIRLSLSPARERSRGNTAIAADLRKKLVVHDLHQLLRRGDRLELCDPDRALLDAFEELPGQLERNVGFEQDPADLAQAILDVGFREDTPSAQAGKGGLEFLGQLSEHRALKDNHFRGGFQGSGVLSVTPGAPSR